MSHKQIGMFDKPSNPSAPPKLIEITAMEWEKDKDGDWVAKGKHGDFLLWKEGIWWKGRYSGYDSNKWFTLRPRRNVKELKSLCESNYYWEK